MTIWVWFFNGLADKIQFEKDDKTPFSENEMQTLLKIPQYSIEVWEQFTADDGRIYNWETKNYVLGRKYKGTYRAWRVDFERPQVFVIGTRAGLNRQSNSLDGF